MSTKTKVNDYIVRKDGDQFILFSPQYSLIVTSDKIDDAYSKIEHLRENLLNNMAKHDLAHFSQAPQTTKINQSIYATELRFAFRSAITVLFFILFSSTILVPIAKSLLSYTVLKTKREIYQVLNAPSEQYEAQFKKFDDYLSKAQPYIKRLQKSVCSK